MHRDLAYAQRQRELDDREEAIAQREQDLMSMRSFASDDDVYSERDATLIKREHDLDDKQNELVEQARMLAQRVTATNAVLDAIHGRLVELARTAGVVVKPEDDREVRSDCLVWLDCVVTHKTDHLVGTCRSPTAAAGRQQRQLDVRLSTSRRQTWLGPNRIGCSF